MSEPTRHDIAHNQIAEIKAKLKEFGFDFLLITHKEIGDEQAFDAVALEQNSSTAYMHLLRATNEGVKSLTDGRASVTVSAFPAMSTIVHLQDRVETLEKVLDASKQINETLIAREGKAHEA